jgi:hypothetical protein
MVGGAFERLICDYYLLAGAQVNWVLSVGALPFTIRAPTLHVHSLYAMPRALDQLGIVLSDCHLFLPRLPNFPGYDLFLLHGEHKILYLAQITVAYDLAHKVRSTCAQRKAIWDAWMALLVPAGFRAVELWFVPRSVAARSGCLLQQLNMIYPSDLNIPFILEDEIERALAEIPVAASRAAKRTRRRAP